MKIVRVLLGILVMLILTIVVALPLTRAAVNDVVMQWVDQGPEGGMVWTMAVDPTTADTIYIAGWSGIYKTVDGGSTWTYPDDVFTPAASPVRDIAIAPSNGAIVYVGAENTLFKSEDAGQSWQESSNGLPLRPDVYSVAIDPANPQIVYISVYREGLYKSTDGGETWTLSNEGLTNLYADDIVIDPENPNTLYVVTSTDLFKSTNAGASWAVVTIDSTIPGIATRALAISASTPDTMYAAAGYSGNNEYVYTLYKSVNGGETWEDVRGTNDFDYIRQIRINPTNPNLVYIATQMGLYRSTTGGTNWEVVSESLAEENIRAFEIDPFNLNQLFVGTSDDGFSFSEDAGDTWVASNTGLYLSTVTNLSFLPLDPSTYYAFHDRKVSTSFNGGETWTVQTISGLLEGDALRKIVQHPTNATILYGQGDDSIYTSTNNGATWTPATTDFDDHLADLLVHPITPTLMFAAGDLTVYVSRDAGVNWEPLNGENLPYDGYRKILVTDPLTPTALFLGHGEENSLYYSPDLGATWEPRNEGLPPRHDITSIIFDPDDLNVMYVSTLFFNPANGRIDNGGVYRSDNRGVSWTALNNGLPLDGIHDLVIDPNTSTTLYVGTANSGVYRSVDSGQSWQPSNDGLRNWYVYTVQFSPDTNSFFAGTYGGVHRFSEVETQYSLFLAAVQTSN